MASDTISMPSDNLKERDTLDDFVEGINDKGIARYLTDADISVWIVNWLYEYLGIPRGLGKIVVIGLAKLAENSTKTGADFIWKKIIMESKCAKVIKEKLRIDKLLAYLDKKYEAKQLIEDVLAGRRPIHNAEFSKDLSLDLRVELETLGNIEKLTKEIKGLEKWLNPQPKLVLRLSQEGQGGINRFRYGTQKTRFLGREEELTALKNFLQTEEMFSWWLVTGAGGLGKSRLALELCLQKARAWRCGFLFCKEYSYDPKYFREWQPNEATLLIVDYASGDAKNLGNIASVLSDRSIRNDLLYPVRLLLLERNGDSEDQWIKEFFGVGTHKGNLENSRYRGNLRIGKLNEESIWEIIKTYAGDISLPDRTKTLARLQEIDPLSRPLYAAMLGDAIGAGRDPRSWNKEALIRDILERADEKFWTKITGVEEYHRDVLAMVTMGGSVKISETIPENIKDKIKRDNNFIEHYRIMSEGTEGKVLEPLEPDIIGEMFVLEHLRPPGHGLSTDKVDEARETAWKLNKSCGMFAFLMRTSNDFLEHDTLLHLSKSPRTCKPVTRFLWGAAVVKLMINCWKIDLSAHAQSLYEELKTLAELHPKEKLLRLWQAKGAYDLIINYAAKNISKSAEVIYRDLETMVQQYPQEKELRLWQAKGVFILKSITGSENLSSELINGIKDLWAFEYVQKTLEENYGISATEFLRMQL